MEYIDFTISDPTIRPQEPEISNAPVKKWNLLSDPVWWQEVTRLAS